MTYWHVLKKFYPYWYVLIGRYWYVLLIVLVCNLVGIGMYQVMYWKVSLMTILVCIVDSIGMYFDRYWYVLCAVIVCIRSCIGKY